MHPQPQPFQLIRSSSSLSLSLPLLGLEADLFYVHEGAINTYAMHFTVPVPADVHELEFSWQSLIAYPVSYHRLCYRSSLPFISNLICTPLTDYPAPFRCRLQLRYTISIEYATEQEALGTPTLSIPHKGLVPQEIESFLVYLPCTGNASLQLPVNVNMVVQGPPRFNDTRLHFKRNKICAKGKSRAPSHIQLRLLYLCFLPRHLTRTEPVASTGSCTLPGSGTDERRCLRLGAGTGSRPGGQHDVCAGTQTVATGFAAVSPIQFNYQAAYYTSYPLPLLQY